MDVFLMIANSPPSRPRSFIPPSSRQMSHPWPSRSTPHSLALRTGVQSHKHKSCLYWSQLSQQVYRLLRFYVEAQIALRRNAMVGRSRIDVEIIGESFLRGRERRLCRAFLTDVS